jgi:hypothetical protein
LSAQIASLWLSVGVGIVALGLLFWQKAERAARPADMSDEDVAYFRRLDRRRTLVAVIMLVLAAGIAVGSNIDAGTPGHPNKWFVVIWLAIFWLVLWLSSLALIDWGATRSYARRHRKLMIREGLEILREELRVRAGRAEQPFPGEGDQPTPS